MEVVLTPETITAIKREVVNGISEAGLVLIPENVAVFSFQFYNAKKEVMSNKYVTPNTIKKYGLVVGVKTRRTIKNMVGDGRITKEEWFCGLHIPKWEYHRVGWNGKGGYYKTVPSKEIEVTEQGKIIKKK